MGAGISLEHDFAATKHVLCGNANDFYNATFNLIINAGDAMPDRHGIIRVETENVVLDSEACKNYIALDKPGEYFRLTISDNGKGMDEGTSQHIFEPFFTTKPEAEGSGLGLAVVYGTVNEFGGYIWCESTPGKGTVFTILLPLCEEGISEEKSSN